MKKKYRKLNLLPFYFRNIGLGIIAITLFSSLIKLTGWADFEQYPEYRTIFRIFILIGFLLIAVSQARFEDERTLEIRMKLYAATFVYGVVSFIISKALNFFEFFHTEKEITAFHLLLQMFVFYFVIFWLIKRKNR